MNERKWADEYEEHRIEPRPGERITFDNTYGKVRLDEIRHHPPRRRQGALHQRPRPLDLRGRRHRQPEHVGRARVTIHYDMPEAEYHARPELSSTGARRILDSPARFRYYEDHPTKPTPAMLVGSATHTKILGVGSPFITYPDEHLTPSKNISTSKATVAWVAEQEAAGVIVLSAADARRVDRMAEAVLAEPEARAILERITGREVTIIQEVDGVPVRARFDIYGDGEAADLKTGRDASPRFNKSVAAFGYHLQTRFYDDAYYAETGERLRSFPLIVVESAPPHLVGVYDLDFMYEQTAAEKCAEARRIWQACTVSGVWPAYGRRTLTAPPWVVIEDDEEDIKI